MADMGEHSDIEASQESRSSNNGDGGGGESDCAEGLTGGSQLGADDQAAVKGGNQGGRGKASTGRGSNKTNHAGQKFCADCSRWLPLENFPQGKAICGPDNNARRNLGNTAKAQNQEAWWRDVQADHGKLKKVLKAYHIRCQVTEKRNKRGGFLIVQYIEEVKRPPSHLFP